LFHEIHGISEDGEPVGSEVSIAAAVPGSRTADPPEWKLNNKDFNSDQSVSL